MKVTILYDNNCLKGFKVGWGFSCLVETSENTIIFDTGWDGNILLHNLRLAGVNIDKVSMVILSHSHWDHIGGLNHLLPLLKEPKVVVLESFSENLKTDLRSKAELIEVKKHQMVSEGVWTTGELGKKIKEQSIIVEDEEGIGHVLITGCAHPDLKSIIKNARIIVGGDIKAIIGGFHDSDELEMLEGINRIVPCHCTQRKREIERMYPDAYEDCAAGMVFNFP